MSRSQLILLTGSYCQVDEYGVHSYLFNQETGEFSLLDTVSGISNPSFVYPWGSKAYVVSEDDNVPSLYAVGVDSVSGKLHGISVQSTIHAAPCNVIVSPDGKYAYTSNYAGASVTEFPLLHDGALGKGRTICFEGSSVHPYRQKQPYIHAVNFSPDGKFLLVDDLGTDHIHVLPYGSEGADECQCQSFFVKPGAGPRHLCFSPDGKWAYLLSELSGDVFVMAYDEGQLFLEQTLKVDEADASGSADIHVSSDGRFVYTSHRLKNDGIAILKVLENGCLQKIAYQSTGVHPRHFMLTPNQLFMLVACRDSDIVQIFSRDKETGLLKDTGKSIASKRPVCVQFL